MIPEIDDALRELVRTEALKDSDVEVVFDAPTTDWAARRNSPTVNMYLYDLREDLRWRARGFEEQRGPDGMVIGRITPPRHYKLSYLVTAWTQRPEDEHRLLDTLLRCFLRHEVLPAETLGGGIASSGGRIPITVGLPPPEDRGFADVWSALGGQLKPSLDIVVNTPIETGILLPAGPPVQEGAIIDLTDLEGTLSERRQDRRRGPEPGPGASGDDGPRPSDDDAPAPAGAAAAGTGKGTGAARKPRARKPR
ncbi:DUF4255 domain-containing protein [Georgenia sp. MJ206]|uniref:DUF4255 domain-containing protein n=1 Tax=Georgenia wangjunii TaxID=3117730 RepID=UPI002F25F1AD